MPHSDYLAQVRRIAPGELLDRDTELAALAAFCTASDPAPAYAWWRAEAWAGKSALLSWFVLHPPPGVRIVSFFVTARYAGQADRAAFVDVVLEQLAELLGEPLPVLLTEATREAHLLGMLGRAAQVAAPRRLLLVVDGLDEDRGVTTGPDAYSIAALLPARPPGGMRVVVAGRPSPPVPSDVPDDHPLRDPGIVRVLPRSAHAAVVRQDAQRELRRLLRGTPAEQSLLGVLTAAGGGLSGADLAELTGVVRWEIDEQLETVSARTFLARDGVYVLAHEELQQQAMAYLGPDGLTRQRARLHDWAGSYRDAGWPEGTPDYLLRGYFRLLQATGDNARMLACATDSRRHARMLEHTGGVTAAIAEIDSAAEALAAADPPDLPAVGRLAVHRAALGLRNAGVPALLPQLWIRLGRPERAEALSWAINDEWPRAQAHVGVIGGLAEAGRRAEAEALARSAVAPEWLAGGLSYLATGLAKAGDRAAARPLAAEAVEAAGTVEDPTWRAMSFIAGAEAHLEVGDPEPARAALMLAQDAADLVEDWTQAAEVLAALVVAAARLSPQEAREFAETSAEAAGDATEWGADLVRDAAARAWIRAGEPDRAAALADAVTDPHLRAMVLAAAADALHAAGEGPRGQELAGRAAEAARSIDTAAGKVAALAAAAQRLGERGRDLAIEAEDLALRMDGPTDRADALVATGMAFVAAGDPDRARALAARAEADARLAGDPDGEAEAWTDAAWAVALTGDPDRAEALARSMPDPARRPRALAVVAQALAIAGDRERAAALVAEATDTAPAVHPGHRLENALTAAATVLATLGDAARAAEVGRRAGGWGFGRLDDATAALVRAGDPDGAESLAEEVTDPYRWANALASAADALTGIGDPERARALAARAVEVSGEIVDPDRRAAALTAAEGAAAAGDAARAALVAERAEAAAASLDSVFWQAEVLGVAALTLARAGEPARAEALARRIPDGYYRTGALLRIAALAPPERAERLLAEALRVRGWREALEVLVRVRPGAARAVADEAARVLATAQMVDHDGPPPKPERMVGTEA